jgi:hypothetical protein
MPKISCDNRVCEFHSKSGCKAEEIQISNEGLCLTLSDFSSMDEEVTQEAEEDF